LELQDILDDTKSHIAEIGLTDGFHTCGSVTISVMRPRTLEHLSGSIFDPLIGLVLQGSTSTQYGVRCLNYTAGDIIVLGQAIPMASGLIGATPEEPFIALHVGIDMQVLRGVYSDMNGKPKDKAGPAIETGPASAEVIDSFGRLFKLSHDPIEEKVLGLATLREIYFRVLRSEQGRVLKRVIHTDSKANQVASAISYIRREYRSTIKVSELTAVSGMSASVLYDAFKRVTANSPLQFQKDLRLTEAHQILLQSVTPISEVAHVVGYNSAAQFSRDFSNKFGRSPKAFLNNSTT
jgi:AraC-like DNA-binding protein